MYFKRAVALCAVLGFSFFAAGCSGNNSAATPPMPLNQDSTAPLQDAAPSAVSNTVSTSTMSTAATTGSSVKLVGKVIYSRFYSSSGSFEVSAGSAGNLWIHAGSGTSWSYNGLTLKVGDYVTVSGTWSNSTTVNATSASLSTSGTPGIVSGSTITTASTTTQAPNLVGQIVYASYYSSTGGFEVKESNGTLAWIYKTSSTAITTNGLAIRTGVYASANGTWKSSNTLTATSITLSSTPPSTGTTASPSTSTPAPTGGVPKHVQTATYLLSSTEKATSPSVYAPYLSWAYTVDSRLGMTQAAGIKTVVYTSPIQPNANTYEYSALNGSYPGVRATSCTGSVSKSWNGTGLLSDPTKSGAASYFQNVVNHEIANIKAANPGYSHPWDLMYVDDDGPLYGVSPLPCNYNASTWGTAQDTALGTTGQKFILNALSVADSNVPTYVSRLKGSAIEGGEFEECFMTSLWSSEEDGQLQAIALLKSEGKAPGAGFWCYADNTSASASSSIPLRKYIYASFLLTYDPNYSVFQESFTTPSTFAVLPETGFVPMNPVSVPTSISGLLTSTGAYEQRYNACYYRGSSLGHCEIVVNPSTTRSVSVPNPWGLHHSMVLSGGGILDGGTATFSGSVPSTLGPKSGLILTP